MYAQSTTQTHPPCPKSVVVLSEHGSKEIATTYIDYLCTDDLSGYVRSLQTISDVRPTTKKYKFAYDIPAGEESSCEFDGLTGAYVCHVVPVVGAQPPSVSQPSRCVWDDGYMQPPLPVYNETTNTCENAVVDVFYNFTWQGSEVLYLNATVVLGDVPIQTEYVQNITVQYTEIVDGTEVTTVNHTEELVQVDTIITQTFNVRYFPVYIEFNNTNNVTDDDNITDFFTTERYQRSGNPGQL